MSELHDYDAARKAFEAVLEAWPASATGAEPAIRAAILARACGNAPTGLSPDARKALDELWPKYNVVADGLAIHAALLAGGTAGQARDPVAVIEMGGEQLALLSLEEIEGFIACLDRTNRDVALLSGGRG